MCAIFVFWLLGVRSLASGTSESAGNFTFLQLSDTHWGFTNAAINPDYAGTLKKAIDQINAMDPQPDFIVFTGDLTHTTDNPKVRKERLEGFKKIVMGLKVKALWFMPGEHDAGLDKAAAFKAVFGQTRYVFKHKGVNFVVLDNVSDPASKLGDEQIGWLKAELMKIGMNSKLVVLTHRPLFNLYEDWDWWTADGDKAVDLLRPYSEVNVFYGHIHQLNEHSDGNIKFHAARGLMYPLPAPGSVPKKAPVAWNPAEPYNNLGYRKVDYNAQTGEFSITEIPLDADLQAGAQADPVTNQVVEITAKRFEFNPSEIRIKKGVSTVLEFTSLDVKHGFNCPGLHVRLDIPAKKSARVTVTPQETGVYNFRCDIFCGLGHEDMTGKIIVE